MPRPKKVEMDENAKVEDQSGTVFYLILTVAWDLLGDGPDDAEVNKWTNRVLEGFQAMGSPPEPGDILSEQIGAALVGVQCKRVVGSDWTGDFQEEGEYLGRKLGRCSDDINEFIDDYMSGEYPY